ncbi:MAG TPA: hypothetical protein VHG11_03585 [Pseudorhizobium sp.]|nr:hypothetical protein [Pseudorhizobium sp.]
MLIEIAKELLIQATLDRSERFRAVSTLRGDTNTFFTSSVEVIMPSTIAAVMVPVPMKP